VLLGDDGAVSRATRARLTWRPRYESLWGSVLKPAESVGLQAYKSLRARNGTHSGNCWVKETDKH